MRDGGGPSSVGIIRPSRAEGYDQLLEKAVDTMLRSNSQRIEANPLNVVDIGAFRTWVIQDIGGDTSGIHDVSEGQCVFLRYIYSLALHNGDLAAEFIREAHVGFPQGFEEELTCPQGYWY